MDFICEEQQTKTPGKLAPDEKTRSCTWTQVADINLVDKPVLHCFILYVYEIGTPLFFCHHIISCVCLNCVVAVSGRSVSHYTGNAKESHWKLGLFQQGFLVYYYRNGCEI